VSSNVEVELKESAAFEVFSNEQIGYDVKHESDVVGVGGAGQVCIHVLAALLVQVLKLSLEVNNILCKNVGC
jgi:hypothetical protein